MGEKYFKIQCNSPWNELITVGVEIGNFVNIGIRCENWNAKSDIIMYFKEITREEYDVFMNKPKTQKWKKMTPVEVSIHDSEIKCLLDAFYYTR
jgi:hypothetical protein